MRATVETKAFDVDAELAKALERMNVKSSPATSALLAEITGPFMYVLDDECGQCCQGVSTKRPPATPLQNDAMEVMTPNASPAVEQEMKKKREGPAPGSAAVKNLTNQKSLEDLCEPGVENPAEAETQSQPMVRRSLADAFDDQVD